MRELIQELINNRNGSFDFLSGQESSIKHLKQQTTNVPNVAGIYLVFYTGKSKNNPHLGFEINQKQYVLAYFGIAQAGKVNKSGKISKQGLSGRINNVVSDSYRGLKHIKRAKYWNLVMIENKIPSFRIVYCTCTNPAKIEESIYSYLKSKKLDYPFLNKKRGRKSQSKTPTL